LVDLLIGGIGLGLVLSIMLGPVFFILLETSIKKGIKSALFLDLGIFLSDLMYITIAYIFVNQLKDLDKNKNIFWLLIVGGVIFIVFGFMTIRSKQSKKKPTSGINPNQLKSNNYFTTVIKGFFLNAINPGILFYWLAIIGTLRGKEKLEWASSDTTVILYLAVILVTFFTIDVFKIIGAEKLRNILTPAWMKVINRVLGIILICIGFIFLSQGIMSGLKTM